MAGEPVDLVHHAGRLEIAPADHAEHVGRGIGNAEHVLGLGDGRRRLDENGALDPASSSSGRRSSGPKGRYSALSSGVSQP